ncbi:MAG TPA: SWIM zinc finger family protein, partial [Flavobacterium sp.]|nr:SWIM zinc finger family protein [Flavobacterium sp.]
MYKKSFAQYIKQHSTPSSISNAYYVYPDFITQRGDRFIYEYSGGSKYPYTIEIELDKKNEIYHVECTCPYDYQGICKHIIASIEDLAERLDNGSVATQTALFDVKKYTKKVASGDVKLHDGKFDLEELRKRLKTNSFSNVYVTYFDLNFTHIKSKTSSWGTNQYVQEIVLIKDQNKLETYCSCSKELPFCEHRLFVFKDLANKFGVHFFKDDF